MLADEYKLIVPFTTQLQSRLTEQISAAYRNFNFSNSTGLLFGLTEQGIPAQQKALPLAAICITNQNNV